jgi:hypothetical protein
MGSQPPYLSGFEDRPPEHGQLWLSRASIWRGLIIVAIVHRLPVTGPTGMRFVPTVLRLTMVRYRLVIVLPAELAHVLEQVVDVALWIGRGGHKVVLLRVAGIRQLDVEEAPTVEFPAPAVPGEDFQMRHAQVPEQHVCGVHRYKTSFSDHCLILQ